METLESFIGINCTKLSNCSLSFLYLLGKRRMSKYKAKAKAERTRTKEELTFSGQSDIEVPRLVRSCLGTKIGVKVRVRVRVRVRVMCFSRRRKKTHVTERNVRKRLMAEAWGPTCKTRQWDT
jgi:hypothetical protein